MTTRNLIIIAVVVVILISLFLFRKDIGSYFTSMKQPAGADTKATAVPDAPLNYDKNLYRGLKDSAEVKLLQQWLGGLTVDGSFGDKTKARLLAVKGVDQTTLNQFQQLANLAPVQNEPWYNSNFLLGGWSLTNQNLFQSGINNSIGWL